MLISVDVQPGMATWDTNFLYRTTAAATTASDTATRPSVVAIRNGTRENEKMASEANLISPTNDWRGISSPRRSRSTVTPTWRNPIQARRPGM